MLISPVSTNSSLGGTASFSCSVKGSSLHWFVDGVSHQNIAVKSRGISSKDTYNFSNSVFQSVLTVECSLENNNTGIQCIVFEGDESDTSAVSTLLIQGNIKIVDTNNYMLHISMKLMYSIYTKYALASVDVSISV